LSDLDAVISFYTDKLGLKLLFRKIDETHHEAFCFLQLAGAKLEPPQLLDDHNRPQPFAPLPMREPYCPHLAIATDDLASLMTELNEDRIPIVKGPLEIPGKVRWFYIHDQTTTLSSSCNDYTLKSTWTG